VPVTYIINPNGQIVARALGPRDWSSAAAYDALKQRTHLIPSDTATKR
jgi:hypothetical protein